MEDFVPIQRFAFEVNAIFAKDHLATKGIDSIIEEIKTEEAPFFELRVKKEKQQAAIAEVENIELDETPVNPDSEGYLKGYQEWSDRMYDPGHYTGGKIPHYFLDKSNWKFFGLYFLAGGLLMFYLLIYSRSMGFENLLFAGLYIFAGWSMLRQLRKKKK